jgi:alpha-glucosidase (family GH31 glycosyl hydrolase)
MTRSAGVAVGVVLMGGLLGPAAAADVRYRGGPAELSVSAVSDYTVQIVLAPLDEQGRPRPSPPSTVLVEQKPQLKFRRRELAGAREVSVGKLRVELRPGPLTVSVRGPGGKVVQELTLAGDDGAMSFRTGAPVLGMGEGARQFDRRGAAYSMRDGWAGWDRPVLGSWVAVPFLIGTDGWAFFVHHPGGQFDLRDGRGLFKPSAGSKDVPLELYVIAWEQPADVLKEYRRLTGAAPLPPLWALGFMQSHRTLSGPEEVLAVARTFRDKKLPCDALLYLGTGYCPAGWNTGHGSLTFNPRTFDKPADLIGQLHRLNFRVVLHQNRAPRDLHGLAVDAPGPGDERTSIAAYWRRHRDAFALGVDGWWPDDGDELPREARLARHRMYHDGPLRDRPDVRPWALHRTGYAGAQRYGGWVWSGDVDSRWATLAAQVAVGQNHSLSLSPYWGTDVGGFFPTKELTGELYVRWFQFGAFCPSFRAHGRTWHLRLPWGWNTGKFGPVESREGPDEAELRNAAVEPVCRKYLELRYRLLPYNYTLCREAHDTGLPLIRALWLHYPGDPKAVARGDEYLWGPDLLVAPVTAKGAAERTLYLPPGDWYDFWTGRRQAGGREVTRKVDLATLPLYVRAGAILPLGPPRQYTAEPSDGPATVRVYPGRDGEFRWYEDDGASLDYLRGRYAWTRLRWEDGERRLTVEPAPGGTLKPAARELVVEVVGGGERRTVRYEGRRVEVRF